MLAVAKAEDLDIVHFDRAARRWNDLAVHTAWRLEDDIVGKNYASLS